MKRLFIIGAIISLTVMFMPIILLVLSTMIVSSVVSDSIDDGTEFDGGMGFVTYEKVKEIDFEMWHEAFSRAGVLSDSGDIIIQYSEEYEIDPVLFAAIAMHETGWGKSKAVKEYNNPGGLMDPSKNSQKLLRFKTLEEGIESMARTLHRLIYDEHLITINQLGTRYAPLDASNDPNGLNKAWVPRVTEITEEFGGLILEYNLMGNVEFEGEKAWIVPHTKIITSKFRTRSRPDHNGIDIASADINGKPIVAFMDGEVTVSSLHGTSEVSNAVTLRNGQTWGLGYYVTIDHGNGIETRYAHLIEEGIPVGTEVKKGETIGYVGSTGGSTGPHLHFEIKVNGSFVDPLDHLSEFLNN